MKNIFRTVTALSLACGVFAFTGCNDYEEDINSINNRLDELTTGQIARSKVWAMPSMKQRA